MLFRKSWPAVAILPALAGAAFADGPLVHSFDDAKIRLPKDKAHIESVAGKVGKAVKFSFDKDCSGVFCMTDIRGKPEWDQAAGFSFWVKGDGSNHFGGLQFIWNDDFGIRYDYMFPIDGTDWKKITVAWSDLTPSLPKGALLDPKGAHAPSKITATWFGKWWYWRDYAAHSYTIDEMRLEPTISADTADHKPAGAPLERVLAKLKAGKPITIVTMGDSLTDYVHWANREVNWPTLLAKKIKEKYKVEVTIENPAIGGTQLRQGLVLMPRWNAKQAEPDLVTVCYGGNDWDSGMRGETFQRDNALTIDRVRRATKGKSDVLIMTTCPGVAMWTTRDELGEACRKAAAEKNAGVADIEKAFHEAGKSDKEHLYCRDKVHLGPVGHELVAQTVLEAIERAGK